MFKLVGVLFLVSCSVSTYIMKENEMLPYKESAQVTKIVQNINSFELRSVKDKRDRASIGKAFTGVKYDITPINLNRPVNMHVRQFLENAFEMRNLNTKPGSELKMDVEINHIWVEEVIEKFKPERAKCKVDMSFHITGGNKKWSGNFWTEFTSGGDMSDGTERLAPTLASCMNSLVEKLVSDKKFIDILK